jgi:hypothetical protein
MKGLTSLRKSPVESLVRLGAVPLLLWTLSASGPNAQGQQLDGNPSKGNLPRYELSIRLLPDAHRLEAAGTLSVPPAEVVRDNLVFALGEIADNLSIDVAQPLESSGRCSIEKAERPGDTAGLRRWKVVPPKPIPAREPVLLRFSYLIEDKSDSIFYIGPEGSFASGLNTAWYPELQDSEGFRTRGAGTLKLSVPPGYTAYANGQEVPGPEPAPGSFTFEVRNPAFFSFAAAKYTVHSRTQQRPISVYLLQPRPQGKVNEILEGSSKILHALVQEFGAYPYSGFSIVEIPTEQARKTGSDGVSLEGAIMGISNYFDQSFNVAFYAHEMSHLWWGNLIQRKGPAGIYMLDEAMAQYGSLRAVEIIEGPSAAEKYRRTGYPGYYSEYSGLSYLCRAEAGLDHKLSDLPPSDGFLCRRVANSKGMLVWDLLSRTVGRERFRIILGQFTSRHSVQRVTWVEFLRAIERGAGRNLGWFYDQWFERTGVADWRDAWSQKAKNLHITITQPVPYYRASVEVQAEGTSCQRITRRIQISGPETAVTLQADFPVRSVTIDPLFKIPHWTREYHAEASALLPYTRGDLELNQGRLDEAYKHFEEGLREVQQLDRYGLRFLLEYGLAETLIEQNKVDEAGPHIRAALACPIRSASILPWVYVQLVKVALNRKDEAGLKWAVDAVATSDDAAGGRTGAIDEVRNLLRNQRARTN